MIFTNDKKEECLHNLLAIDWRSDTEDHYKCVVCGVHIAYMTVVKRKA